MTRTIIVATATALLASATFGVAATSGRGERPHGQPSAAQIAENAAAFSDARIAALKAGLRLNADQLKLWPALEMALNDLSQQRIEYRLKRIEARQQEPENRPDLLDRMRDRADMFSERGDGLKKLVAAAEPLYASLDEAQQRRFSILLRHAQFGRFADRGGPGRGEWRHGPRHFHEQGGAPRPDGPRSPDAQRL